MFVRLNRIYGLTDSYRINGFIDDSRIVWFHMSDLYEFVTNVECRIAVHIESGISWILNLVLWSASQHRPHYMARTQHLRLCCLIRPTKLGMVISVGEGRFSTWSSTITIAREWARTWAHTCRSSHMAIKLDDTNFHTLDHVLSRGQTFLWHKCWRAICLQ